MTAIIIIQRIIKWGDAGVGRFKISRKDLKNRNFENAYLVWDCS
ncbi:MAG: DUF1963 domain-containing protein [Oscillospiraceae bacterium]|nr:DUF1963 domain-containing protein [Oscillospiraceae bacterium]